MPDPTGTSLLIVAGIGAAVGAVGGAVGSLWGVMTDDPYGETSMGSAALYSSVTGLAISTVLLFAVVSFGSGHININRALIAIVFLSSVLSTASGFLIEDLKARSGRAKEENKPM